MNATTEQGAALNPLPPGVSLVREYSSGPVYEGTAETLISAGLIRAEWIVGLGRYTRAIVLNADGGFSMPCPDGKRGSYSNEERKRGLTTIKRLHGMERLQVQKYRTKEEEREFEQRRCEQWDREREIELNADPDDAPIDAKSGVVARAAMADVDIDNLRGLIEPFCGLRFTPESEARILRLCDELRRAFAEARMVPTVPRYHTEGNVIHFPRAGGQEARP